MGAVSGRLSHAAGESKRGRGVYTHREQNKFVTSTVVISGEELAHDRRVAREKTSIEIYIKRYVQVVELK